MPELPTPLSDEVNQHRNDRHDEECGGDLVGYVCACERASYLTCVDCTFGTLMASPDDDPREHFKEEWALTAVVSDEWTLLVPNPDPDPERTRRQLTILLGDSKATEVADKAAALRNTEVVTLASRNEPCPCGSGMKYKRCHGHPQRRGGA
ncbi:MAG TPA: SEC-C metal-binding domain-containing protein [Streptosporangiaceae bacterium]|nr:SEC-C metal-binding domain-containing protein [Streptosporangiaceae bacterium]